MRTFPAAGQQAVGGEVREAAEGLDHENFALIPGGMGHVRF